MQVFKDYNLAGLKYVNVGDVRFRQPLPKGLRRRTKDDFLRKEETHLDNSVFFFGDNVGGELLWPTFQDEKEKSQRQQVFREEHWLKKQTSCDLEFDTTVENLLNIHDVMTALPSPLEERQKIHWRAVPSLREIWEQERKRMKILLSPETDFLSLEAIEDEEINSSDSDSDSADEESSLELPDPNIPQFTLDVKKNASVPGTRLAVKGVKQLFRTSDGLEDDFRRAMKDIVLRHDRFIDDVDQKIINDLNGGLKSSPSLDDGIDALASLGHQFTQNSAEDDDEIVFGSQLSERTSDSTSVEQSQSNKYNTTQLTQAEIDDELKVIDSSDSIQHENEDDVHSDDDFLCEEEELGEEGLERTLTFLASQAVESAKSETLVVEYDDELQVEEHNFHSDVHLEEDDSNKDLDRDDNSGHIVDEEFGSVYGSQNFRECMGNSMDGSVNSSVEQSILSGQHVLESKDSLRRGDIEAQSDAWYPLPNVELNETPPWFIFQYSSTGDLLSPVPHGTFFEPVKGPPSYNYVKSWIKANSKPVIEKAETGTMSRNDCADMTQMGFTQYSSQFDETQDEKTDPLAGLGQQGCRVQVSGGGGLKSTIHTPSTFTPMTIMSVEIHVQCRIKSGLKGHKEMAMV
jgi:hypothetical protein